MESLPLCIGNYRLMHLRCVNALVAAWKRANDEARVDACAPYARVHVHARALPRICKYEKLSRNIVPVRRGDSVSNKNKRRRKTEGDIRRMAIKDLSSVGNLYRINSALFAENGRVRPCRRTYTHTYVRVRVFCIYMVCAWHVVTVNLLLIFLSFLAADICIYIKLH